MIEVLKPIVSQALLWTILIDLVMVGLALLCYIESKWGEGGRYGG